MTRRLMLTISVLAMAVSPAAGRAQPGIAHPARSNADPNGERELRAILGELEAAVMHHDGKVVEKYYSPDYVMTFRDGRRDGFDNSLHVLTDTNRNVWRLHESSNEHFTFYGNTAIVNFTIHSQWTARASHKDYDVREQVTQTWVRRDGRWTLVATHVTAVDPAQASSTQTLPFARLASIDSSLANAMETRARAEDARDTAAFSRLTTDDFIQVSEAGEIRDKAYRMHFLATAGPKAQRAPRDADSVTVHGTVAVRISRVTVNGSVTRHLTTWIRENGQWRVAATSITPIRAASP